MHIFFFISISLLSINGNYLPSSLALAPLIALRPQLFSSGPFKYLFLYSILLLCLALLLHGDMEKMQGVFRSFLILCSVAFCCLQGKYYLELISSSTRKGVSNLFFGRPGLILSLCLVVNFWMPFLAYEPSSLGRSIISAFVLIYLIPYATGIPAPRIFSSRRAMLINFCFGLSILAACSPPSLSLGVLLAASIAASLLIAILSSRILLRWILLQGTLRLASRAAIIFVLGICLAAISTPLFLQVLDARRIRNAFALIDHLKTFNLSGLLTLGGGRFLATYVAYLEAIKDFISLDYFMLDRPCLDSSAVGFEELTIYSGLSVDFLEARRPGCLLAWLLFNLKFLSVPYLYFLGSLIVTACRVMTTISSFSRRYAFIISLVIAILFLTVYSPVSFYAPVTILFALSRSKKLLKS